jgi:transposase InsO family protein
LLDHKRKKTRLKLSWVIFGYIEVFRNRRRPYSMLGWGSPVGFERSPSQQTP